MLKKNKKNHICDMCGNDFYWGNLYKKRQDDGTIDVKCPYCNSLNIVYKPKYKKQ